MSQKNVRLANIMNFIGEVPEDIDKESIIERKQFSTDLKMNSDEERTMICKLTTNSCDLDGDVVIPQGVDLRIYNENPVVYFGHKHSDAPVGKTISMQINEADITAKIKIADTTNAEDIWKLIRGSFLKGISVGFVTKKALIRGTREFKNYVQEKSLQITDDVKRIVTNWMLVECSLCGLPCNSEALITAISEKSLQINDKLLLDMGIDKKDIKVIEDKAATQEGNTSDTKAKVEVKEEVVKEVVKVTEVVQEPKVEPVIEVIAPKVQEKVQESKKPIFFILRNGSYIPDLNEVKAFSVGKIVKL